MWGGLRSKPKPYMCYQMNVFVRSVHWRKGAFTTYSNGMGGDQNAIYFLQRPFPLIHLKGNGPLNQGIPVGLCLWGRGCQSRTDLKKLQWLYCPQPPPPSAGSCQGLYFKTRMASFNLSGLRVIYHLNFLTIFLF